MMPTDIPPDIEASIDLQYLKECMLSALQKPYELYPPHYYAGRLFSSYTNHIAPFINALNEAHDDDAVYRALLASIKATGKTNSFSQFSFLLEEAEVREILDITVAVEDWHTPEAQPHRETAFQAFLNFYDRLDLANFYRNNLGRDNPPPTP